MWFDANRLSLMMHHCIVTFSHMYIDMVSSMLQLAETWSSIMFLWPRQLMASASWPLLSPSLTRRWRIITSSADMFSG